MIETWKFTNLGKVFESITNGVNCDQKLNSGKHLITRIETISKGVVDLERIGRADLNEKELSKYRLTKNDILFSHINSPIHVGKTALFDTKEEVYHGVNLLRIRTIKDVDPKFLRYFLLFLYTSGFWRTIAKQSVNQASVNQKDISAVPFSYPSIDRQREIVEKLDSAFAEIELSFQKTTECLNFLSSCFDSFLDKIIKNQILEFGLKKMVEVLEIARGGSPRPISSYLTNSKDGVNWVKISDATSSKKYITETSQKIKPEGVSRSRLVKPGDFLLSNSMSFGRPYIMGTTGCIHDGWLVLSNDKKLLNQDYLYYVLGSKYIYDQFNRSAAGSTVRNLNISLAGQVTFPVPDLETQESVVTQLMDFETSIDELKKSTADKLSKLLELKNSILSGAFKATDSSEAVA